MFEIHPIPTDCRFKDLTGMRFGRLVVVSFAGKAKMRRNCWNCLCDCGQRMVAVANKLTTGRTKSCVCLRNEKNKTNRRTHGNSGTVLHALWKNMRQRCLNPKRLDYARYGGRGIKVCDRWKSFQNFRLDMGEKPQGMSIDRINNSGNYEPDNCRWADDFEQCNNRRDNHPITYEGITLNISQWSRQRGINISTICTRIRRGRSTAEILSITPLSSGRIY